MAVRASGGSGRSTPTRGERRRADRDRGTTLIEIVITISLTAMVVLPLMSAVRASITASSVARSAAQAETAIVNAADRINRAPQSCDYSVYAEASVQTQGWNRSAASVSHQWYDPIADAWVDGGCRFAAPTDELVQKVTVTIITPDRGLSRTIQVVKSNV